MRERLWFTMGVRLVGLALAGWGVNSLGAVLGYCGKLLATDSAIYAPGGIGYDEYYTGSVFMLGGSGVFLLVLGTCLLFGADSLGRRLIGASAGLCVRCAYDLAGESRRCPECGFANAFPGVPFREQPHETPPPTPDPAPAPTDPPDNPA